MFCSTYRHFKSEIIILSNENQMIIFITPICQLLKFQITKDIFGFNWKP